MKFKPFENKICLSTVGENINEVERRLCEKVGCKYSVALSAGMALLHLAVKFASVKFVARCFVLI